MKIHVFAQMEALYRECAEKITRILEGSLDKRRRATWVLTGGNTPKTLYSMLASSPFRERLSWSQIDFLWGDERCVTPQDPQSNFGMAWEHLLSVVPVPAIRIHRAQAERANPEGAARLYETVIQQLSPDRNGPRFDLVLLGMGGDGHTASLFPGTHWNEQRLFVHNYVAKLQAHRLTMTPRALNAAREIVFIVTGKEKAAPLAEILENGNRSLPASRIRPESGHLSWYLDQGAASLLSDPRLTILRHPAETQ